MVIAVTTRLKNKSSRCLIVWSVWLLQQTAIISRILVFWDIGLCRGFDSFRRLEGWTFRREV